MTRQRNFSLGSALFGWAPARFRCKAHQLAPEAWRAALLRKFPDVLSGFFSACRAGRELVFLTARKATFSHDCTEHMPSKQRKQLLTAARQRIDARAGGDQLQTALCIDVGNESWCPNFRYLCDILGGAAINELLFHATDELHASNLVYPDRLDRAIKSFPQL